MNSKKLFYLCGWILALAMISMSSIARADDKEDSLKKRFEDRYPQLRAAETDGKIGETSAGLVEAVDPKYLKDDTLKKLIDDENTDRSALYKLIADDENAKPEEVAERAAKRNFDKAKPGDYLKDKDGHWSQKKSED